MGSGALVAGMDFESAVWARFWEAAEAEVDAAPVATAAAEIAASPEVLRKSRRFRDSVEVDMGGHLVRGCGCRRGA